MSKEIKNLVKEGYNNLSDNEDYWKKGENLNINIYKYFKELVGKGKILELGSGDGSAIGFDLIKSGFDYLGIDLSDNLITKAQNSIENGLKHFKCADMMDFTANESDNKYDGIVTMFADFHVPREHRVQLYLNFKRILKPGGFLFFTCHPSAWEGYIDDYEGKKMYWSLFSNKWYEITLRELGYEFISSFRRENNHRRKKREIDYFMIFQKKV